MPRTGVMLSHTPVRAALQDIRILHMLLDVKPNLRLVLLKVFGMSGLCSCAKVQNLFIIKFGCSWRRIALALVLPVFRTCCPVQTSIDDV